MDLSIHRPFHRFAPAIIGASLLLFIFIGGTFIGCSRAPLPAVKNALGGASRNGYYPWQSKNLYHNKIIAADSVKIAAGYSAQPLCIGAQQYLVPTNAGGIVEIYNDSMGWYFGGLRAANTAPNTPCDSSACNALAMDSAGNCYATTQHSIFSLTSAGALRWRDSLGSYGDPTASLSPVLVLNSRVYCCSGDGDLDCFDLAGTLLWTKNIGHPMLSQVAGLANGSIAVVYSRGDFHETDSLAVYDASGNLQWMRETPGVRIIQGPIVTGEFNAEMILVAGAHDSADARKGVVCAFTPAGNAIYTSSVDLLPTGISADMEGNAYITGAALHSEDVQSVVVLVDKSGSERWGIIIDGIIGCPAAVTNKYVYFPVATNYVRVLYQLSHEGKTEEMEALPKIAFTPYAPIVDGLGRIILANKYGSQLFTYESDIAGKIF